MKNVSAYRGVAGEVVRLFARLSTLLTVMPTIVFLTIAAMTLIFFSSKLGISEVFIPLVLMLAVAPVLGSSGLGARGGDLESGISYLFTLFGEVMGFTVRYVALTIAWGVPVSLTVWLLLSKGIMTSFSMTGFTSVKTVALGFVSFLVVVVVILAPVFTLIIALASGTLGEAFSKQRWVWLFYGRSDDFKAFFAAYIGGMAIFYIISFPVMIVLIAMSFVMSVDIGIAVTGFVYFVPLGAGPVLLGRLAGSFVAVEFMAEEEALEAKRSAVGAASTTREILDREVSIKTALDSVHAKAEGDIEGAIVDLLVHTEKYPESAPVHAVLGEMYLNTGREDLAVKANAKAIALFIKSGERARAAKEFMGMGRLRRQVELGADEYERLAQTLLTQKNLDDAVWCFQGAVVKGGDKTRIQKGIIAAAEAARMARDNVKALEIFGFFIKKYPDSHFIEYCRNEYRRLKGL